MKRREEMTLIERLYFWEIFKGVLKTFGDMVYHTLLFLVSYGPIGFVLDKLGMKPKEKPWATLEYPDEAKPYAPRFRGRHRLTLNNDGGVRCTACFLCATACPANCIYIEAAEHEDENVEKFPDRYEIDTLLCIYCGYCVEACPVDAIRMDTGIHPEIYPPDPRAFIEDKETLMMRSRVLEDMGPDALFKAHLKKMVEVEKRPFETDY